MFNSGAEDGKKDALYYANKAIAEERAKATKKASKEAKKTKPIKNKRKDKRAKAAKDRQAVLAQQLAEDAIKAAIADYQTKKASGE